jgi:hypothetical protein
MKLWSIIAMTKGFPGQVSSLFHSRCNVICNADSESSKIQEILTLGDALITSLRSAAIRRDPFPLELFDSLKPLRHSRHYLVNCGLADGVPALLDIPTEAIRGASKGFFQAHWASSYQPLSPNGPQLFSRPSRTSLWRLWCYQSDANRSCVS